MTFRLRRSGNHRMGRRPSQDYSPVIMSPVAGPSDRDKPRPPATSMSLGQALYKPGSTSNSLMPGRRRWLVDPPIGLVLLALRAEIATCSSRRKSRAEPRHGASLATRQSRASPRAGAPTGVTTDAIHLVSADSRADEPLPCFLRSAGKRVPRPAMRGKGAPAVAPGAFRVTGAATAPRSAQLGCAVRRTVITAA